jgi:CheY-like chemotaxis protein
MLKILLIDDDKAMSELWNFTLQIGLNPKYILDLAEGTQAAAKILDKHDYDIVICDNNMRSIPGSQNGEEFGLTLAKIAPRSYRIFSTGDDFSSDTIKSLGFNRYHHKGDLNDGAAAINEYLELFNLREKNKT